MKLAAKRISALHDRTDIFAVFGRSDGMLRILGHTAKAVNKVYERTV